MQMIKNALDSAGSGKQASDRAMEAVIEGRLSLEKAFAENLIVLDAGGADAALLHAALGTAFAVESVERVAVEV